MAGDSKLEKDTSFGEWLHEQVLDDPFNRSVEELLNLAGYCGLAQRTKSDLPCSRQR